MDVNDYLVRINTDLDVVTARQQGRTLAAKIGFSGSEQVLIATAISEAARNILQYAGQGSITSGPGIMDIEQAMIDGYSSSGGLGLGLPGIKRLMSDLEIRTQVGKGTTLIMKRWRL
jgi:serine/threonine-protein kinase RsbT